MSKDVAILVPVLGRPQRVRPTLDAFNATVPGARILFIASSDDSAELEALGGVDVDTCVIGGWGYAEKIRAGIESTDEPVLFFAADDIEPENGWYEVASARMKGRVQVVGVNDQLRRKGDRVHSTHFLVTREYARLPTIDGEPGPFYGGYSHSFVDDEFIATARKRGVYRYVPSARMKHRHPMAGDPDDDTYRLGREHFRRDRKLFQRRRRLHRL